MHNIKNKEEEVLVGTQWFRDNLKIIFKHDLKEINIILSFLHGYGKNIGCKYEDTYTQVFYGNLLKLEITA
jgi:hypothetical protein